MPQARSPHAADSMKFASIIILFAVSCASVAAPLVEPIKPLPLSTKQDPGRVDIGRQLFLDVRLSANGRASCSSCHDLAKGGVDGRVHSIGFSGKQTGVNAPTVL